MHAAAVSYVLMADQGDTFKRWYKEAGQDLGNGTVLATVDAEGRLLEDYFLEPKELIHFHRQWSGGSLLPQLRIYGSRRVV